jgi:hypothetical protein
MMDEVLRFVYGDVYVALRGTQLNTRELLCIDHDTDQSAQGTETRMIKESPKSELCSSLLVIPQKPSPPGSLPGPGNLCVVPLVGG